MPVFEPWCGHQGTNSPDPRIKEFSHPLIEVSSDYLTMISESLLQSHNGLIRLFPGCAPDGDAQFANLVAEGCVLVSAQLAEGKVRFVTLHRPEGVSLPGRSPDIRLRSPWTGRIETWALPPGRSLTLTEDGAVDAPPVQEPEPAESPQPRILHADAYHTLWLGRKRVPGGR